MRLLHMRLQSLRHRSIIQCLGNRVGSRSWANVPSHLQVQTQRLLDAALPLKHANDRLNFEISNVYNVHVLPRFAPDFFAKMRATHPKLERL